MDHRHEVVVLEGMESVMKLFIRNLQEVHIDCVIVESLESEDGYWIPEAIVFYLVM